MAQQKNRDSEESRRESFFGYEKRSPSPLERMQQVACGPSPGFRLGLLPAPSHPPEERSGVVRVSHPVTVAGQRRSSTVFRAPAARGSQACTTQARDIRLWGHHSASTAGRATPFFCGVNTGHGCHRRKANARGRHDGPRDGPRVPWGPVPWTARTPHGWRRMQSVYSRRTHPSAFHLTQHVGAFRDHGDGGVRAQALERQANAFFNG